MGAGAKVEHVVAGTVGQQVVWSCFARLVAALRFQSRAPTNTTATNRAKATANPTDEVAPTTTTASAVIGQ